MRLATIYVTLSREPLTRIVWRARYPSLRYAPTGVNNAARCTAPLALFPPPMHFSTEQNNLRDTRNMRERNLPEFCEFPERLILVSV